MLIKISQKLFLQEDFDHIKKYKKAKRTDIFNNLCFIDRDNILRTHSRLDPNYFSYDVRNPYVIPTYQKGKDNDLCSRK